MKNNLNITPIKVYIDPVALKTEILQDNKNKSGIYCWINLINKKCYVGSSKCLDRRFSEYYYNDNRMSLIVSKGQSNIYQGILKYNLVSFKLYILEYCEYNLLFEREQYYIDLINPEYNILKKAGSRSEAILSLETKRKISNSLKKNLEKLLPIKITNIIDNSIILFSTNVEASKYLGISERTLRRYKVNKKIFKNKYLISNDISKHKSYK